jgi:DNA-binding IclR family transcriptional regulator
MTQTGDLETDVMNLLQVNKRGATIAELSEHLKRPQAEILTLLRHMRAESYVTVKDGIWSMIR